MAGKAQHRGVCLSEEGRKEARWQLDIRAWLAPDWAAAAGVSTETAYRFLAGNYYVAQDTAGKFQQAFLDNPPIPGLAELLEREEEVAL